MNLSAVSNPNFEQLRAGLVDVGDGVSAQLAALYAHPSVPAAQAVAANLDGARRAVLRFAEAMRQDGTHGQ